MRTRVRKTGWILCSLGCALVACSDGRTPVVVYSPHGRDLLELLETSFEAKNPGIDVRWLDMGSQEVYDRLRSERANPQCDLWFGGPETIFRRAAAEGLLAPYRPSWAESVPAASRAPGDLYFGVYRTLPVLVWNQRLVADADAPRDWDDLLSARFAGKLLLRDPMASGVMRTVFGMVLARSVAATGSADDGFAWLLRLDGATKEIVANPALLHEKLMRGEGEATMWELTDTLLERQKGVPFGYGFAASGTPVIDDSIGLVAGAPHRAAAVEFLEYAGGAEAQLLAAERAFRIPARTDLAVERLPEWARDALARMRPADFDHDLVAREIQGWMSRWDATVRGRGGHG
ncbi:MAG: extracellular solute-binding protein [Thermoanaerobaculia bacterium]